MILTLISMFGGGLMRLLPEIFNFLNKKTDNKHELDMLDRQFQLEQTRAAARVDEMVVQGNIDTALEMLKVQGAAVKAQMQKTGITWVDAANFAVRPLTTYYMLLLYGVVKIAMFIVSLRSGLSGWEAILHIYDHEDRAMLSGILAFWFVGRVFDKHK
ncbi:MAG TPA: hypothetical protein VGU61_19970 [Noviherbaspirillum sp.]|jgi:hypothetical protein|uniref:hypothetical protein n=1 Tax=Noviherbaspirillum sp. TaxID=1926288 RepID=UPI002DDD724B|nr:hypothetical protein [Noviherbaspirillum sp.]HEV2612550.1 hypothetical protein [Noviherbaspirillum sp.]